MAMRRQQSPAEILQATTERLTSRGTPACQLVTRLLNLQPVSLDSLSSGGNIWTSWRSSKESEARELPRVSVIERTLAFPKNDLAFMAIVHLLEGQPDTKKDVVPNQEQQIFYRSWGRRWDITHYDHQTKQRSRVDEAELPNAAWADGLIGAAERGILIAEAIQPVPITPILGLIPDNKNIVTSGK